MTDSPKTELAESVLTLTLVTIPTVLHLRFFWIYQVLFYDVIVAPMTPQHLCAKWSSGWLCNHAQWQLRCSPFKGVGINRADLSKVKCTRLHVLRCPFRVHFIKFLIFCQTPRQFTVTKLLFHSAAQVEP